MDRWKQIESPEIHPCLCGQLIFDKKGRSLKWSKNSLFNKGHWEIWTSTHKKIKLDYQLTPYTTIKSRWIKELNINHDTIEVVEENIGSKISDTPLSNIFANVSPRAREIKEKNRWDYIKVESFCTAKENIIKMKRDPSVWEIFLPMMPET